MDSVIEYLGIGGMDVRETHRGDLASLAEHITRLEEQGGHSLSVSEANTEQVVYECGGFVVQEKTSWSNGPVWTLE